MEDNIKYNGKKVIVVLEFATLSMDKIGRGTEKRNVLINCDDHRNYLQKRGKSALSYRPDITHQCLLTLLDSPLNKSGHLQVYVHTTDNILIEVNSSIKIPRTYNRFAGLMVRLLENYYISAADKSTEKLLRIIKNPVTIHFEGKCDLIGLSGDAETFIKPTDLVKSMDPEKTPIFFIGAMAKGEDDFEFAERKISISRYCMSAAGVCAKICNAFEDAWEIY